MKLVANYHTHCKLCGHAIGMSKDYIKKAIALGYQEIGISDHCFVPQEFMSEDEYKDNWLDRQMNKEKYYNVYLPDIEESIASYGDKIKIWKAVEVEYIPGHIEHFQKLHSELDYLNLGIHFFMHNGTLINCYDGITPVLLSTYADCACEAMATKLFKIFVHPDLFMFNYSSNKGYRIFDDDCEKAAHRIIQSAIENDVYLELNCGGISKGIKKINNKDEYLYPRSEFWQIVAQYPEAKVVIGVDAHKPSSLNDESIDIAIKMLNDLKIKRCEQIKLN